MATIIKARWIATVQVDMAVELTDGQDIRPINQLSQDVWNGQFTENVKKNLQQMFNPEEMKASVKIDQQYADVWQVPQE